MIFLEHERVGVGRMVVLATCQIDMFRQFTVLLKTIFCQNWFKCTNYLVAYCTHCLLKTNHSVHLYSLKDLICDHMNYSKYYLELSSFIVIQKRATRLRTLFNNYLISLETNLSLLSHGPVLVQKVG